MAPGAEAARTRRRAKIHIFAVVVAVTHAELIKNIVYEPIVLGRSVKLHPLVVVLGVVGGATLFGPAGMCLAIPTIMVVKVLIASSAKHLDLPATARLATRCLPRPARRLPGLARALDPPPPGGAASSRGRSTKRAHGGNRGRQR